MTRPMMAARHSCSLCSRPVRRRPDAAADTTRISNGGPVVQLNEVPNQANLGVKLFGLAGGDPAMNGLMTYIGFYAGPGDGWRVFQIGDFLSYRILSATPGRVNLQIQENTINSAGEIGTRTRRISLRWTPGRGDERPATVSMTRIR